MAKKNLKKLRKEAHQIAGFGAVVEYGCRLNEKEIKILADYSEARGGNRESIESILRNAGRPFSIDDPTFRHRCLLCKGLNNYCCC